MRSVVMTFQINEAAKRHLLSRVGQEDLCFALWRPSQGRKRHTAIIYKIILPGRGERRLHGGASFMPDYYERALGEAIETGSGLAFMHSHLGPGWQDMSHDDFVAEQSHSRATVAATGFPFVGLTVATDGVWSARFWEGSQRIWCHTVRVLGDQFQIFHNDRISPRPVVGPNLLRTVSVWGEENQAALARLRVGIVGAGSVGFLVGQALAKLGVVNITILDFDRLETKNLDRTPYAGRSDIGKFKSEILARFIAREASSPAISTTALTYSVCEPEGLAAALDMDVIFSCVDRPWPRSVLNFVAYSHLIPVVDGGIAAEALPNGGGMRRADWRAHVAAPGRRCLECLGQYDPADVILERNGQLDDPAYIAGLDASHWVNGGENVFVFSMAAASLEVLQLISMVVAPAGVSDPGAQLYHAVTGELEIETEPTCSPTCLYPGLTSRGDQAAVTVTGPHGVAEASRVAQGWRARLARMLGG